MAPLPPGAEAQVPMASGSPTLPAPPAVQPTYPDTTAAILAAVEEQLTRYFGAMSARADAVQHAGEAGRAELIVHFQHQIDTLRAELDLARSANAAPPPPPQPAPPPTIDLTVVEAAIEAAADARLDAFAAQLPARIAAATEPLTERLDGTTTLFAARIEELQHAARRFDEQATTLIQHANETTGALTRRMDDGNRLLGEHINERTRAVTQGVDDTLAAMRADLAESETQLVDRMLAMEERVNDQTGSRFAAIESTISRISGGIDEAIVALSHRVIELENDQHALVARIDDVAETVGKVDEEAINQIRDQLSAAIGESMLVRIELERVATSTGDHFDTLNVRIGELAAQIADTELDVSTAVQLERLEEIERALVELDPDQFVRKEPLPERVRTASMYDAVTGGDESADDPMLSILNASFPSATPPTPAAPAATITPAAPVPVPAAPVPSPPVPTPTLAPLSIPPADIPSPTLAPPSAPAPVALPSPFDSGFELTADAPAPSESNLSSW